MKRVTVTLNEENIALIESIKENENLSRSAAIREVIERYEELTSEYEDLHTQHTQLINQYEERESLVKFVETERKKRKASLSTRLKWFFFGMD
jgi:Ribbon-helix-helix protein, copG family.